jgi:hypothetical protein
MVCRSVFYFIDIVVKLLFSTMIDTFIA